MQKHKVLVILGSTGVGKSKFALSIAKAIKRAEIINADAMQCFRGLDIATNKPTKQELESIPHHLFSFKDVHEQFNVHEYRREALKMIEQINQRGNLPILVGGTNLYIQAVVFKDFLSNIPNIDNNDEQAFDVTVEEKGKSLYEELKKVDPEMAEKLHPNDTRKILRCLQIYKNSKMTSSVILKRQEKEILFDSYFIWLGCDKQILYERINNRTHEMIKRGLLDELLQFKKEILPKMEEAYKLKRQELYTHGILQSIGYKEFENYFTALEKNIPEEKLNKILQKCIEKLQTVTRNYARKQIPWLKNMWAANTSPLIKQKKLCYLDTSDISKFDNLINIGIEIAQHLMNEEPIDPNLEKYLVIEPMGKKQTEWKKYKCEICNKVLNGQHEWEVHLKSKMHRIRKSKLKKL